MTFLLDPILAPLAETIFPYWGVWRPVPKKGAKGFKKKPYHPRTGKLLRANDPGRWTTFDACKDRVTSRAEAEEQFARWLASMSEDDRRQALERGASAVSGERGVGIVLFLDTGGDYRVPLLVCIDVDLKHLAPDDPKRAWALGIADRFESFTQRSPSGDGFHILCWAHEDVRNRIGSIKRVADCIDLIAAGFVTVTDASQTVRALPLRDLSEQLTAFMDDFGVVDPPPVMSRPCVHDMTAQQAYAAACVQYDHFQSTTMQTNLPAGYGLFNRRLFPLIRTLREVGAPRHVAYALLRDTPFVQNQRHPSASGKTRQERFEYLFNKEWPE